MKDSEIWKPKEQFDYLMSCARAKGYYTAKDLATAADVDPSVLSRMKNDYMKNPSFIPVVRLYSAAGASLDYSFGIEGLDETERGKLEAEIIKRDKQLREQEKVMQGYEKNAKQRWKLIYVQTIIICALAAAIVSVLIYDKLNPSVGWLRKPFRLFLMVCL